MIFVYLGMESGTAKTANSRYLNTSQSLTKPREIMSETAKETPNGTGYTSEIKPGLQTKFQRQRADKDKRIAQRYQELIEQPGAMPTAVRSRVMKEFGLHSPSTVYRTLERVQSGIEGESMNRKSRRASL